ncbi:MAG: tripartite tricarboxylate transporter substrate binding protein [Betaproteobacteria bacterium]|nr:tripartite tricarboxylate transporter substrate binding protein [Betaproteobacteria bacterium]
MHALRSIAVATVISTAIVATVPPSLANCLLSAEVGSGRSEVATIAPNTQSYPSKPVRVITGSPSTAVDIVARQLGQRLGECWRRPVVIDNRGGAGLTIGTALAAKAAPDGYTLLMTERTAIAVAPNLHKELSYVPMKDLAPITLVVVTSFLLTAHPSLPVSNLREFIDHAKRYPGAVNMAIAGPGTGNHIATELLKQMGGIKLVNVQYKGGGAAALAVVSGEAQAGFVSVPIALPHVRAGKLKVYANSGKSRFAGAPEIPTVAESGLPGYDAENWSGMFAPAGTPEPLIDKINRDVVAVMQAPALRTNLVAQGSVPATSTPTEFAAFIKSEITRMKKLVEATGMRTD